MDGVWTVYPHAHAATSELAIAANTHPSDGEPLEAWTVTSTQQLAKARRQNWYRRCNAKTNAFLAPPRLNSQNQLSELLNPSNSTVFLHD